ncbi:amino acid/amide ABC transporter substrate-binding protein, HAAT family [Muriicola jejuensis]|uniref:LysM peptidoglycan-binding domain-containing protein n=1 Tax=Muriicola jejuensis TaxID=504488 RepID=A0A6P0U7E4_9FLAO|nr:LysM peptidoglycan-binding domain-containing protein [Muriicola jejuensis]NER09004.1 LysM peptidoglycan-binding domain-containing protein [Muriicola jejuensis]SMP12260.1 amino acid/amide ABC transporter substrate-binding protein, HAAT family [Muriicola jejuensis]
MMKALNCLFLFVLFAFQVQAQQFKTHAVKEGETLYSISKLYRVTPYNILKYNKELKQGDVLKPNTILVIPVQEAASVSDPFADTVKSNPVIPEKEAQEVERKPIRFRTHRVRKKETLYGISRRYEITEDDLKRYNKELYSTPLQKGMRLQIPEFPEEEEVEDLFNSDDFETYTVSPKETRWSIAHKYGITIDSMIALNPSLEKSTSHLAVGQQLLLPRRPGTTVDGQEVQLYESYTVPAKKTMYSLSGEYGITSEEIIQLNPAILEQGGLKEGMVLRLPKKKVLTEEINAENYIFYEVKPKQTEFSLTRKLGIGFSELRALNPELSRGLKAGMILKLPREKAGTLEVRNSLVLDKISLLDSISRVNRPSVMVLLPFRINRLNLDSIASTERAISRSNALKYSLGLYSGALVAVDSLADLGISVKVRTYDTELSAQHVKAILARENLSDYQAILGPLQADVLKEVASQARPYNLPIVAPLSSQSDLDLPNVFFSVPSDSILRNKMLDYMESIRKDENIVVISDSKKDTTRAIVQKRFPMARSLKVIENEKNISVDIEKLKIMLSTQQDNWVLVETDNFKLVSSVTSILNSSVSDTTRVRMFTTNKNKAFENEVISVSHLSNLNFTYPSIDKELGDDAFVRRYRNRFGGEPDKYAVRGFDLTYDLLLKLAFKPNLFSASDLIGLTEYTGNKFDYARGISSGYFNLATYIMKYENMRVVQLNPVSNDL